MNFQTKLKFFKLLQSFLAKFNFKIFYSKDKDFTKNLNVENIIDVGVEKGTNFLINNFPKAKYFLIEANSTFYDYLENNFLKRFRGKLFKIAAGKKKIKNTFMTLGQYHLFLKEIILNLKKNFLFSYCR